MGNGHGGKRPGAGRKTKPLSEKMLEGNPGHASLKKLKAPICAAEPVADDAPPVAEYLKRSVRGTAEEKVAPEIFKKTWAWLKERGCEQHVKQELIEQYALTIARWIQCEEWINTHGLLAKHPTTGNPMASPYVTTGFQYLKQANILWGQIFQIVKENSSVAITGRTPNDDVMSRLLAED
jgi:hypothetical protein